MLNVRKCLWLKFAIALSAIGIASHFSYADADPSAPPATTTPAADTPADQNVPLADDEPINEGDDVVVIADAPLLGDEEKIIFKLGVGLPLVARQIHEQWVLVNVVYNGETYEGWVDRKYLTLISPESPGILHDEIKDVPKRLAELHASSEQQLSRSQFLKTMETCSALLKLDPTSAVAFFRRGYCQQLLGEETKAIADFDEAIKLEPKYELAYLSRGDARFSRDEFDEAIADYGKGLELNPNSAGAHYMRGRAWYEKGDHDKALADFNEAIRLLPNYAWAIAHRGDVYFAKKDYDAAIADFDKATQIDRDFDWAVARRADAWFFGKNNIDRAIADYTFAHVLNPDNSWAIHQRGHCLEKKRDFAQALVDYEEAAQLDPEYWDFRNNLAWLLATCPDDSVRDGARAVEEATQACELTEWKDSFALGTLAAAEAEAGAFDKAVEHAKKAIELKSPEYDLESAQAALELYRTNQPYHEK